MEDSGTVRRHGYSLASRKAEESALRRYQASHWLECLVGPLGISSQPSEREFISCLRNGLVLCKLMNRIQPGSVPKVVVNQSASTSQPWDSQPLPAYQYFENVRNFLVAVEALKLPVFEASIFERDNVEDGSSAKVVDCILSLKAYHEWQRMTGDDNGTHKPPQNPFVVHLSGRNNAQSAALKPSDGFREMDVSASVNEQQQTATDNQKLQELIVKALAQHLVDTKENLDNETIDYFQNGKVDVEFFGRILSTCLEQQIQKKYPELKSDVRNICEVRDCSTDLGISCPQNTLSIENQWSCRACLGDGNFKHRNLFVLQEKELLNLKALLSSTKKDFQDLQAQIGNDLKQLGNQLQDMSYAAQKYHKVVEENRSLYNMVQDMKGNIRVYCRIRPALSVSAQTVIDFIGQDGSLVIVDPFKIHKDGRKCFQFNHVFGPNATRADVYKETQPLIRSVMDGYNVCILAYGQTGSGKTYTMGGPSCGSNAESGINYLALNDLFRISYQREDIIKYEMHVQMVEIYNEQVRDLLVDDSSLAKLEIRSCSSDDDSALPEASLHRVMSTTDVISLMKFGETNRAVGSTAINQHSSRSHSVLTIHVHGEDVSGGNTTLRSCLHLVDLAGSEHVDVNKSLSCLGDVIMALSQKKNSHIPYRNSKLTLLLQNALGGHAKTLMFAHVSPEEDSFGETMSTLKFAQRVSTVQLGAANLYKESSQVVELKSQIESLKAALEGSNDEPKQMAAKTPNGRPKHVLEKTPQRVRRLSTENCSNAKEEGMKFDYRKRPKTPPPSIQPRLRRLSLEGPRSGSYKKPVQVQSMYSKSPSLIQEAELKRLHVKDTKVCSTAGSKSPRPPRSPTKFGYQVAVEKPDVKTPESMVTSKNESQKNRIKSEHGDISSDFSANGSSTSRHGKGYQIKKSLRSIGKFINGSERSCRNQQKLTEAMPVVVSQFPKEAKSPISRRQSLIGVLPSQSSRRSSLGGAEGNRNSRTPPPDLRASSTRLKTHWM